MTRYRVQKHPVLSFAVAVTALYLVYRTLPPGLEDDVDTLLVFSLSIAFTWAAVLMVRRTRIWTPRGMGLLGTVMGDALLYLSIGVGAAFAIRGEMLDLARACLTVGVVLLLIGLIDTTKGHGDEHIVENVEDPAPEPPATNLEELKKGQAASSEKWS